MSTNKTAKQIFITGLLVVVLMSLILAWFWKKLPPQLPWFYSLPGGEQQLVNKIYLVAIVAGLALVLVVTKILASWASKDDAPVETTVLAGGLMVVVLFAASFFRIIQIFAL